MLMGVFLLTSAASFAAPNVAVLYATRVVAALVSGTLTAVAMLYAKEVAAPEQTARAISPGTTAFLWQRCWECPWALPCARSWAGGGPSP